MLQYTPHDISSNRDQKDGTVKSLVSQSLSACTCKILQRGGQNTGPQRPVCLHPESEPPGNAT